ncbi:MAG: FAD-dependent oxidoreductase [Pseudomonadota bacterium]
MNPGARIAIVGSGVSGLVAAHTLKHSADVTLFEAGGYFGGHTHTVDVTLPDHQRRQVTHGVDTGFLVYNERTYPGLISLLDELGVKSAKSDMSFSVHATRPGERALEWSGASLSTVFAQRSNLHSPRFWGMLRDLLRFNALCTRLAREGADAQLSHTLEQFLEEHRFGAAFRDWYLLPMLACIWSCPTDEMLRFPLATMIRFCHNHGLIQIANRPQWYTVDGGARQYVLRILEGLPDKRLNCPVLRIERDAWGVTLITPTGRERFDEVVIATHTDQALAMLAAPSTDEAAVLGAIRYQPNRAVLHTDTSVMPARKSAWAAWNYESAGPGAANDPGASRVCLHYWINRLQPLPFDRPVIVSLNPVRPIDARHLLGEYAYDHPVFDLAAMHAQRRLPSLQGRQRTWFCGAWAGYGFHEDGLQSGLAVAGLLGQRQHSGWREAA